MLNYKIRDEVEKIIKELHLNRSRIFEVSHLKYREIIEKTVDTFIIKDHYYHNKKTEAALHWSNIENRFKPEFYHIVKAGNGSEYCDFPKLIPENEQIYVLLEDNYEKFWVYEMYVGELVTVLDNLYYCDYYIVSKKFRWLISEDHHQGIHLVGDITKQI